MTRTLFLIPRLRLVSLAMAIISGAILGAALASEHWGGLVPCALCLVERWPWRAAIGFALLGVVLPRPMARLSLLGVLLAMLAG